MTPTAQSTLFQLRLDEVDFHAKLLSAEDLSEIVSIEQRAHPTPWQPSHFASSLAHHVCIGLKQGNQWVGYAVVSFVVGEAELLLFVVDTPWQGKGLAKAFLAQVIALCSKRASMLFLEVRESNFRAVSLYEGVGFNQVGVRPNYYPAGKARREDALLYALELAVNAFGLPNV